MMSIPDFPIQQIIPDVKRSLEKQSLLILQAPPGAGKSTILPLQLMDEPWLSGKKIIMLEPRRIAARAVATRMASLCDEPVGKTIGYRIRFENKVSAQTQIEIVTEGILTRMLQNDNALEGVGMVIFDEFHERSLQADLALALCYQLQQILRPDLKILIMSATLDGAKLSALLNHAPILTSEGRQFPVTLNYIAVDEKVPLHLHMARIIKKALGEQEGDILAFFPGAGEIQRTQQLLEQEGVAANVLPLYGDLSQQKQQEAIAPDAKGIRKVVLATSIAETSLTIEGIKTVIDSGYARVPRFDPRSGLTKLETIRVTKDAADQRAGRAGRITAGVCYRLWSEGSHMHLIDHRKPEILEADLAPLMLELSQWGIKNMEELTWLTLPSAGAQAQARELLHALQALKENQITEHGKKMLQLPTHPRIANMLMESLEFEKKNAAPFIALACDVAALLEERDPLQREAGTDISLRIEVLRKYRSGERVNADRQILDRIERLSFSWRKLMRTEVDNQAPNHFHIGKLIATAYPERIAQRIDKNGLRYRLGNGRMARLAEHDPLSADEWIAIAQLDAGTTEGKIFLATAFDSRDLMELATEKKVITWDNDKKMVVGSIQKQVGNLTLESKPIHQIDESDRITVICKMIREEGLRVLNWGEAQQDLQTRILSLRAWRRTELWPDVTEAHLLDTLEEWLSPYLIGVYKLTELQKLDFHQIILSILPWELSQKLNTLAPAKIEVPTGSMIKLQYAMDGSKVEMAVRLQELFGLLETPTVNEGRNKIVIHLLSPGYKPVQITQDLKSFWSKTYFEVRKDLLSRYPKHHWPTDPLTAQAVRGPKKRQP
ncbi:MAG TPA: ATP-dependent helicase HrpB [Bacteroidia bacterium]|nr:ATP-dependent helicase HrpB [Bacteroidia bacterium]